MKNWTLYVLTACGVALAIAAGIFFSRDDRECGIWRCQAKPRPVIDGAPR